MYRSPPRNVINHVARVSSGVNEREPFVKFHVSGVKRSDAARDAPADIIPRRLLLPLSRSSHFYARAPQSGELIHARNLIAARRQRWRPTSFSRR